MYKTGPLTPRETALVPFSLEHFDWWCAENDVTLDTGEPFRAEGFQREILADLFAGEYDPRAGLRPAFHEIWIILPEGNAKTTLVGLVALYYADHTPQPWVPLGASSRDQAEIMFGQAAGFVERSARLKERFRVYEGYRRIKHKVNGGRGIKVYAADVKTGDGVIPSTSFIDELHRQDDLRLYRLWKGKRGKRGSQTVTISTAGEPGSDFEETREKIRAEASERVRDGCHLRAVGKSGRLIYHEWAVPSREQATDLELVKGANPLPNITVEALADKLASETLDFGEDWLRLTCNIPSRSSFAAVPESVWDGLETGEQIPEGAPVVVGADFAWQLDDTALVPLWMPELGRRLFGAPEILTPPQDGTMLDPEDVKTAFTELAGRYEITYVVADKSKAQDTLAWVENELGVAVVDRGQTNELFALDYERFMEGLREGWIRHTGHPGFRRHVLNAVARRLPGDKHRFDRPSTSRNTKSGRQERRKIDALTAAAMAHSFAVGEFKPKRKYRGQGFA